MMKLPFSVFALFFVSSAWGQVLFPEKMNTCETKPFLFESDTIWVGYQPEEAILFDFLKKMETRYLKRMEGELFIQMLIDSKGHACCLSFENKTDVQTKRLGISNAVQSMNGWKILKNSRIQEDICVIIKFTFTKRKFVAERLGYHAKSKFSVLGSTEVKRSAVKE